MDSKTYWLNREMEQRKYNIQNEKEYQKLREENANLKQQIRQLETELESQESSSSDSGVSNVDLLRRISQLEKFVYGKYNNN